LHMKEHVNMEEQVAENSFLIKIESRLSNLEDSVKSILDRGDEMNEVTQEKLGAIQVQLETQAASMRRLRRNMSNPYSYRLILCGVIFLLVLFAIILHYTVNSI